MPKVTIATEGDPASRTNSASLEALRWAIATTDPDWEAIAIDIAALATDAEPTDLQDTLLCPLTLHLPPSLPFDRRELYETCGNVAFLRSRVASWDIATGDGNLWLPIVLTSRGPLYAEVICCENAGSAIENLPENAIENFSKNYSPTYRQPFHLKDDRRQPAYRLGRQLLDEIAAPPAVYLLQFGWESNRNANLHFDRLFPFPAQPAIASLGVQQPDLFRAHWLCLRDRPILDLKIANLPAPKMDLK